MTHAHFFFPGYDEVRFGDGWIFGRQGESFGKTQDKLTHVHLSNYTSVSVGLYSHNPAQFFDTGDGELRDFLAPGVQNVWICEVGSQSINGSFTSFVNGLDSSTVRKHDML